MVQLFIQVRVLDVIDMLLVAFMMYQLYMFFKGTVAINIFIGIFSIYLVWLIVKALKMQLLGSILGQVIGVGAIAIIIVFQQEIRRFLLIIGTRYFSKNFSLDNLFSWNLTETPAVRIKSIVKACIDMSEAKIGGLIAIERRSSLKTYAETGDILNANTSSRIIVTIFFKNTPLHDGAIIIKNEKVLAARCILPITEKLDLPPRLGLRHRAAVGLTEHNDALVIVVSEETGEISLSEYGDIKLGITPEDLLLKLEAEFAEIEQDATKVLAEK